ncbi:MAG: N-6 DNA Methylase [Candidatus Methanolliviera sp. GoM_oil]|nr:MAG: N-6 DNA Methylase [Candidatus Methanolliviera sp. GoM_oil]
MITEGLRDCQVDVETHYRHILETLGKGRGMLGVIFKKSQNRIQDPAKLRRLIELINQETWVGLDIDVKGEIYEGCGTGDFLLAAHDYISKNYQLDKEQKKFLKYSTFKGKDIVDAVVRRCVMNLYLHSIGGEENSIEVDDSLISDPKDRFDMVLTNPPFGKKSSITITNGEGKAGKESLVYEREDFWATTLNKQLNFLQHVKTLLKINGKAAIVVPDNVLFEGGAGETIRRKLLHECDVHTLLRLPTGVFYAQGVKANVLFVDRRPASEKP